MLPAAAAGWLPASRARAAVRRGVQLSHVARHCRRTTQGHAVVRVDRRTTGDRCHRARTDGIPGRHHDDRRRRRSVRTRRPAADAAVVRCLPRVCDWFRHAHGVHARGGARTGHVRPIAPPADRPRAGDVARREQRGALHRVGRRADARSRSRQPEAPSAARERDSRVVRAHGPRSVGDSACVRRTDRRQCCARRRDVFTRLELRNCLHPGKSWSARGVEPRGGHSRWCGGGRRSARARSTSARLVLGGSWTGDLSAPGSGVPRSRRRRGDSGWSAGNAALLSTRAVCVRTGISEAGGVAHCRARRPRSDPGRLLPRSDLGA